VKLHSLTLTNFRQHAASHFVFRDGITGIVGRNGSGKSTVLEAIAWALYGQPAARGTKDSIRSLRAPARAGVRVELDFELGGHRYRVVRGLAAAELYLDGALTPIATTLSAVTDLLQRALGMTRQEFFQTYFTGQKELAVMAAMTPAERGQFLARVLGYDQLRVAQEALRERRRELTGSLAGMRATCQDPAPLRESMGSAETAREAAAEVVAGWRSEVTRARDARESLAPAVTRAEQARTAYDALRVALSEAERDIQHQESQASAIALEIAQLDELRQEYDALEAELAIWPTLEPQRVEHERLSRAAFQAEQLSAELSRLGQRAAQLWGRRGVLLGDAEQHKSLQQELADVAASRRAVEAEERDARAAWTRDLQDATSTRDRLRVEYSAARAERQRIAALGAAGTCPTCTRALGDSLDALLATLDATIAQLHAGGLRAGEAVAARAMEPPALTARMGELTLLTDRERQLQRQIAQSERAVSELERCTTELKELAQQVESLTAQRGALPTGYDPDAHAALDREIQRLAPLHTRAVALNARLDRASELQRHHLALHRQGTELTERATRLRADLAATGHSEVAYHEAREVFTAAADRVRVAELGLAHAEADVAAADREYARLTQAVSEAESLSAQVDEVARDMRLHHELDRVYSALRTEVTTELRPELSAIASGFLAALTDGRYTELELDEHYQVVVLDGGRPKPVISGGEEDLTNLALRLAISQMIAERNGQRLNLLVLDEIFGALDEQRQANVVELLRSLCARFDQILIITHLPVVRGQAHEILLDYDASTGTTLVRSAAASSGLMPRGSLVRFDEATEQQHPAFREADATKGAP
jgi:DNA repair protein SbcC/Rad50